MRVTYKLLEEIRERASAYRATAPVDLEVDGMPRAGATDGVTNTIAWLVAVTNVLNRDARSRLAPTFDLDGIDSGVGSSSVWAE